MCLQTKNETKAITIWSDKRNIIDWLMYAGMIDCRYRIGYEKVTYRGYNCRESGDRVRFDCDNAWGGTSHVTVLAVNVDSIM